MGSFLSSLLCGNASADSSAKKSGVKSFHSSADWKFHFNQLKDSSHLVVIDFSASWCGPCKFIEPAIHAMANKFTDVEFIKIDVDELSDVPKDFEVQAMPTFVLMKKGKENDRVVGADEDELERKIEKHRKEFEVMPTFVPVKEGKETDRVVGANEDELERKIEKHRA